MHLTGPFLALKWAPIFVALIGSSWAVYFVLETRMTAADEPDTFLFISYLIWPLAAAGIAVIVSVIRDASSATNMDPKTIGLEDPRRILLVTSLPIYGIAIVYGGFLVPSILYVFLMVRFLGVKSLLLMAGLVVCITAIVWFGFFYLLGVPLQLWPPGF